MCRWSLRRPYEGYTYFFKHPLLESSFGKKWFGGLRGLTIIFGGKTMASAEVFTDEPIQYVVFCIDGYFMVWDSRASLRMDNQGVVLSYQRKTYLLTCMPIRHQGK